MPSQKKTAIVAPTKKPTAFVVPSIIVDPGTPHFTKKSPFVSKESDQDIIKSSITNEDKDGLSDTTTDQTDSFSIEKSSSPSPPPLIILQNVPKFEIHEEETDYLAGSYSRRISVIPINFSNNKHDILEKKGLR